MAKEGSLQSKLRQKDRTKNFRSELRIHYKQTCIGYVKGKVDEPMRYVRDGLRPVNLELHRATVAATGRSRFGHVHTGR